MKRKTVPIFGLLSLAILATPGCLVVADLPPGAVYGPAIGYGYEPLFYNGYVVYYTGGGEPYDWRGGNRFWLPGPVRGRYVTHWRYNRPGYGA